MFNILLLHLYVPSLTVQNDVCAGGIFKKFRQNVVMIKYQSPMVIKIKIGYEDDP